MKGDIFQARHPHLSRNGRHHSIFDFREAFQSIVPEDEGDNFVSCLLPPSHSIHIQACHLGLEPVQRKTVVVVLGLWQGTGPRATGRTLQGPGRKVTMVVTVALRPPRCQGTRIRVAPKAPALIVVVGRTPTPIQNRHVTPHGNPEWMVATFKNRPVRNLGTMTIQNTLDQEILRIANARSAKQLPRVSLCLSACARSSGLSNYIYIYMLLQQF